MLTLKQAIDLQNTMPVGSDLWKKARARTWAVVQNLITPDDSDGIQKYDSRAIARELEISVGDLITMVGFAEKGDYPERLYAVATRATFSLARLEPPEKKPRTLSREESFASLRRRISY